jgi:Chloroplast envelope transporter
LAPAEEEEKELSNLRKLLCLTKEAVADIDMATKGRIFRKAVESALGAGIDGFTQVPPHPPRS